VASGSGDDQLFALRPLALTARLNRHQHSLALLGNLLSLC
jgi:hypothetical protein